MIAGAIVDILPERNKMQFLDGATLARRLTPTAVMDALHAHLGSGALHAPLRHAHELRATPAGRDSLLMMPAWQQGHGLGVKLVTVMTAQARPGQNTVNSIYILFDAPTGAPIVCLDGEVLTARRTAAQSALAARFLARSDATHFLMVGTGSLSQAMVEAHCAARPFTSITLWGRRSAAAEARALALADIGITVRIAQDLEAAVGEADIICCATTARDPIVVGQWLRPGQHLDLVGAFRPDMREVDDEAMMRAILFVDTIEGCLAEAGDLVQPIAAGRIDSAAIAADIGDLCAGRHKGRRNREEITLFKSVGTARADLVAARLAMETA